MTVRVGTAGWAIPGTYREHFPPEGSQLVRYAACLSAAEINSSFHRQHSAATYARWAASVGDDFRFSVKLPKTITHVRRLVGAEDELSRFTLEVAGLGRKLAVLLVQLPPSLNFDPTIAAIFFARLQSLIPVQIACEPRHPSWFCEEAEALLGSKRIARVAADPARIAAAASPGGWGGFAYFRLHGSPRIYWSAYAQDEIEGQSRAAVETMRQGAETWVIYDNTASGAAMGNALMLRHHLLKSEAAS